MKKEKSKMNKKNKSHLINLMLFKMARDIELAFNENWEIYAVLKDSKNSIAFKEILTKKTKNHENK